MAGSSIVQDLQDSGRILTDFGGSWQVPAGSGRFWQILAGVAENGGNPCKNRGGTRAYMGA